MEPTTRSFIFGVVFGASMMVSVFGAISFCTDTKEEKMARASVRAKTAVAEATAIAK